MNAALQIHIIQVFLGFTGRYLKPAPIDAIIQGKSDVVFGESSFITKSPDTRKLAKMHFGLTLVRQL